MKYFMGLDNGGTATKAALYDAKGNEIKVASVSTAMITPAPGYVERDMEEMWQANCQVIRTVVEESGVDPADIAGVGIAGHGKGLYLWGKDEKPLGYGIGTKGRKQRSEHHKGRQQAAEGTAQAELHITAPGEREQARPGRTKHLPYQRTAHCSPQPGCRHRCYGQ